MPNNPSGSFIPKRATSKPAAKRGVRRVYILTYIAYAVFFGTLLSVGGVFFFHSRALDAQADQIAKVEEARKSFSASQIAEVRELDARIEAALDVLNAHMAPSHIFSDLESVILNDVRLVQFSYIYELGKGASISFTGTSDSFDAALFQREAMAQNDLLASADITAITYGTPAPTEFGEFRSTSGELAGLLPTVRFEYKETATVTDLAYDPNWRPRDNVVAPLSSDNADTSTSTEDASSADTNSN